MFVASFNRPNLTYRVTPKDEPLKQIINFVRKREGESGILSVLPPELLVEYNKSDLLIRVRNIAGGVSTLRGFTAEKPERLRGPLAVVATSAIWLGALAKICSGAGSASP